MQNSEKMGSLSENMRGDDVAEPAEIIEYRRQRAVRKLERKDNKRARRAIMRRLERTEVQAGLMIIEFPVTAPGASVAGYGYCIP